MPQSKPFVVATEGPTIDGRNIPREKIIQMAASYDPKVYTAVVNLEHLISLAPDSTWGAYGKVISLATQEAELMGDKKLQLLAVVDVADDAVKMQKAGKKAFSSIEIQDNFLGKGVAYMSGLAMTDTPASIGTESMKFSAFPSTKDNIYAFPGEVSVEFSEDQPSLGQKLLESVKQMLAKKDTKDKEDFGAVSQAVQAVAGAQAEVMEQVKQFKTAEEKALAELKQQTEAIRTEFNAFREKLNVTLDPHQGQRPSATGSTGAEETDC